MLTWIVIAVMISKESILLFDGDCNLCNSLTGFVRRHDTSETIMFSPLHSAAARSSLERCGLPADNLNSAVYIKEGKYYIRSSAILHTLKDMGSGWSLFYAFIIIPEFIRDFFYNLIAGIRYRIFSK